MKYSIFLTCITFVALSFSARADIVETHRGEFHNGIVLQDTFKLDSGYATFKLKKTHLRSIYFKSDETSIIETNEGEVLQGEVLEKSLITSRQLGPDLDIATAEIKIIEFSKPRKAAKIEEAHIIGMQNGDVFLAKSLPARLEIKSKEGPTTVDLNNISMLDFSFSEDLEEQLVRITLKKDQSVLNASVIQNQLSLTTLSGQSITLPFIKIALIQLRAKPHHNISGKSLFPGKHAKIEPPKVIRDKFIDGSFAPELIVIPAGTYTRGYDDLDADFDEKPLQRVTIPNAFAIGRFEVTFNEFALFAQDTNRELPDDSEWGMGRRPVINVTWEDAKAYTQWLSQKTNTTYRLPTDAEWEYAARAGNDETFPWGQNFKMGQANCGGCGTIWDSERTAPVGRFPPNQFELYDMAGNVFEWTEDCWNNTFKDIGLQGQAYQNPAGCGARVIRGGSWTFPPKEVRSANRWRDLPQRRSDDTGFRVVKELVQ